SGSLQIERAAVDLEINPIEIVGTEHHGSRSSERQARLPRGQPRPVKGTRVRVPAYATRRRRGCSAAPAVLGPELGDCGAGSGAGAGPLSGIQPTRFSTGIQTFPY